MIRKFLARPRRPASGGPTPAEAALLREAAEFVRLHHAEEPAPGGPERRLAEVRDEIRATGTYRHTTEELTFGARVAWRNSNRCIGRLYWRSLRVRDLRGLTDAEPIAEACAEHLVHATNGGRIRPLITVFAPDAPGRPAPRIWNEQLIRYAGYRAADGRVLGDPRNAGLTDLALRLGWPGGPRTAFDVLPLVVEGVDDKPRVFELPRHAVLEVPLDHPDDPWSQEWGLRWHAVPAISGMCLEIGGIHYPAAPFNGWYMGTEIGARNLADTDRYDLLPRVAHAARPGHRRRPLAVEGPRPGRAQPGRAALLRPGRGDHGRPPHGVPALRTALGARGAQGPLGARRLVVDRAADVGRDHRGVPPHLRRGGAAAGVRAPSGGGRTGPRRIDSPQGVKRASRVTGEGLCVGGRGVAGVPRGPLGI